MESDITVYNIYYYGVREITVVVINVNMGSERYLKFELNYSKRNHNSFEVTCTVLEKTGSGYEIPKSL